MFAAQKYFKRRKIARSVVRGRPGAFIYLAMPLDLAGTETPESSLLATACGEPRISRTPIKGVVPGYSMRSFGSAKHVAADAEPAELPDAPRGTGTTA